MCDVCFQPECDGLNARPPAATHSTRLSPGERDYRGYGDWAIHPEEATFLLHRGYALVDGKPQRVRFLHNESYVTMVHVEGTNTEMNLWATRPEPSSSPPASS